MNNTRREGSEQPEVFHGLAELISKAQLPIELDERCKAASRAAYAIDRMRRERVHHRITALPLDRYIKGLAALTGVSLQDIQSSLCLASWDHVTSASAAIMARVSQLIGLSLAEAELSLRWTYLTDVDPEQSEAILATYRGEHFQNSLENALRQREAVYSEEQQAELHSIVLAIGSEYDARNER